jgi:hypothetical protein
MATPKEMVDARLKELRMSKGALMKKVGYQTGYPDYYNVFVTKPWQLTDEVKEKIAAVLGRQPDWLKDGGEFSALRRERYIREQFELYLQSEVGREADPETHRILASMQWTGKYLPSKRLYQHVTLAMEERYTAAQLLDSIDLEEQDRKAMPATKPVRRKQDP